MKEIVVATRNHGKLQEIRDALQGIGVPLLSLGELPHIPSVEEDGSTYLENALKKARVVADRSKRLAVADDSGLEVDCLRGEPGVRSARFAGEGASDLQNNRKLLELLKDFPPARRGATFRCVIAVVSPEGREAWVEGVCRGLIADREYGAGGFGYDPLFLLPVVGKTLAELPLKVKNRVSHRGRALAALRGVLSSFLVDL